MVLDYSQIVDALAEKTGILPEFEADGGIYTTSFETKKALLDSLGIPVRTLKEAKESLKVAEEKPYTTALPPVTVVCMTKKTAEIDVTFVASKPATPFLPTQLSSKRRKPSNLPSTPRSFAAASSALSASAAPFFAKV